MQEENEDHVIAEHHASTSPGGRSLSATPLVPGGGGDCRYLSHSAPPSHSHPHGRTEVLGGAVSENELSHRSLAHKSLPLTRRASPSPTTPTDPPLSADGSIKELVNGMADVESDPCTVENNEAQNYVKTTLTEDNNIIDSSKPGPDHSTSHHNYHNKYANASVIYRPKVVLAPGPSYNNANGIGGDNKINYDGSSSSLSSPSCLIFEEKYSPSPTAPKGLGPPPRPPVIQSNHQSVSLHASDTCSIISPHGSLAGGGGAKYRKTFWDVLAPTYKSRTEDFKKLFRDELAISADDNEERLLVDYSCALQREILIQGRMYVTQNWVCFYANIFRWESKIKIRFKDIVAVSKEKLARIIPNAITISTRTRGKYTFASFTARDKSYLMLFRVWQNALLDQPLPGPDLWALVHESYGGELGLTSDDDDYVDPFATAVTAAYSPHDDDAKSDTRPIVDHRKNQANLLACVGLVDQISRVKSSPNLAAVVSKSPSSLLDTGADPLEEEGMPVFVHTPDDDESADQETRDTAATGAEGVGAVLSSTEDEGGEVEGGHACLCEEHPGKLYLNLIINKPAEEVFHLLFSKSQFFQDIQLERNTKNMVMSEWRSASLSVQGKSNLKAGGKKKRVLSYVVEISSPLGTKSAPTTEKQTLLRSNKHKSRYVVQCEVTNSGVPYSDSYYVICLYCITQTVKGRQCRLTVHCHIGYRKSVFSLVKNIIEKNCQSGLQDYFKFLGSKLISELRAKSVSKERGTKMSDDAILIQNGGSPRKSLKAGRNKKWSSPIQDDVVDRNLGEAGENSSNEDGTRLDSAGIFDRLTSSFGLSRHRRKRHITVDDVHFEIDPSEGRRVRPHPHHSATPSIISISTALLYLLVILLCAHTTFLQYKVWYLEREIIPSTASIPPNVESPYSIDQSTFISFARHSFGQLSWLTLPFRMVRSIVSIPWGRDKRMGKQLNSDDMEKGVTLLAQLLSQMEKSILKLEAAFNQTHQKDYSHS